MPARTRGPSADGDAARRRRLLLLAYYYPPIGGAGVQRGVKFLRYLPELGYDATVLTGPGSTRGRLAPADETLLADVPRHTGVVRVEGPEPPRASAWTERAERWLRLRSPWARWWIEGARRAGAAPARGADVLLATMSPWETGEAAAALARDAGVPWVADLRDPWALDEVLVYPTGLHRRWDLARMRAVLRSAAAIVMNTPEALERLGRAFPELAGRATAIPNGYDAADFEGPTPIRRDSAFRIVHTGYLHTELGRRHRRGGALRRALGGSEGADLYTRSHVYLLEALERLRRERPDDEIEVHLAGVTSDTDRAIAERYPFVKLHGYLAHADSIALIRSADALFLPYHDLPAGTRATTVPGKTYEYLASGRPILAAVPDGDVRDILAAAGHAVLCRPADVEGLTDGLARLLDARRAGEAWPVPESGTVRQFERRTLTAELARVLDSVAGAPRHGPAAAAVPAAR